MAALTARRWLVAAVALGAAALALLLRPTDEHQEIYLLTGEIRLGVDPSYQPFVVDSGGVLSGFDIALAAALAQQTGLRVTPVTLSFDGLWDALRSGRVDALASVPAPPPGIDGVALTTTVVDRGWALLSATPALTSWDALAGRRLAVEFASDGDTLATRWLRRLRPFDVLRYETARDALDAVLLQQADAALVTTLDAGAVPQSAALYRAIVAPQPLHIAVRAADLTMLARLNEALTALEADGTLDALRLRWLGVHP